MLVSILMFTPIWFISKFIIFLVPITNIVNIKAGIMILLIFVMLSMFFKNTKYDVIAINKLPII